MRRVRLTKRQIIDKLRQHYSALETNDPYYRICFRQFLRLLYTLKQCRTFQEAKEVFQNEWPDADDFCYADDSIFYLNQPKSSSFRHRETKRLELQKYLDEALDSEYYYHDEDMTADMYQL